MSHNLTRELRPFRSHTRLRFGAKTKRVLCSDLDDLTRLNNDRETKWRSQQSGVDRP